MTFDKETLDDYRQSWRNHQGDKFSDRLARQSLVALAYDVPEFMEILKEEGYGPNAAR